MVGNQGCRYSEGILEDLMSETHWGEFTSIPFEAQGSTGANPTKWVNSFEIDDVPSVELLPNKMIDRSRVRAMCIDPRMPVLLGYVCAMAWGGQGTYKRKHAKDSWSARGRLEEHLNRLRDGKLARIDAYDMFCGSGRIPGLGPSFFTKLLYFFSSEPNFYIMDQWTAKSVILLTGERIVKMSGDLPSTENTGFDYERFCRQVDVIADELSCPGQVAEERMFSAGGVGRRKPREWRAYVKQHWKWEWERIQKLTA
jgi:hypothetical protein